MAYLALLIAGALLCNAIPHLVSGLRGERFFTPWTLRHGDGMGSAVENALWGAANLALGALLIDRVFGDNLPHGLVVLAVGFVATAIALARTFARRRVASSTPRP
jgi:hypothetical protein